MAAFAGGVLFFLPRASTRGGTGSFPGFLAMFLLLFLTSGVGNGSTFRMIPVMFLTFHERLVRGQGAGRARPGAQGRRQGVGGGDWLQLRRGGLRRLLHPAGLRHLDEVHPDRPLWAFVGFIAVYVSCILITWWFYARRRAEMPC